MSTTQSSSTKPETTPLTFQPNKGQFAPGVLFVGRSSAFAISLTETDATLALRQVKKHAQAMAFPRGLSSPTPATPARHRTRRATTSLLKFEFIGNANVDPHITGRQRLPAKVNYFIGDNPNNWRAGVPTFAQVRYGNLYPGVNLLWYVSHGRLEYDWRLRAHADASKIGLSIGGAESLAVDKRGRLVIHTSAGKLTESRPYAYQKVNGVTHSIKARWHVGTQDRVRLRLGKYNHNAPLTVDPTVSYSTYLNSGDNSDGGSLTSDGQGGLYVTGSASGVQLPGNGRNFTGSLDAFVTKLDAASGEPQYTTYLGGEGTSDASGRAVAVDASGTPYVAGYTGSADLPNHTNSYDDQANWLGDAFIAKLDPGTGAVVFTTYIGGANGTRAVAVAADGSGGTYLAGWTPSPDLPAATNSYPGTNGGAFGLHSAFVSKVDANTGAIDWSTYVGGSTPGNPCCGAGNEANALSVDADGNVYMAGTTASSDLPNATNSYFPVGCVNPPAFSNTFNAFVSKVQGTAGGIMYTTYVGGGCRAYGEGLAIQGDSAYLVGTTNSPDLPNPTNVLISDTNALPFSAVDAYVSKLATDTGSITYSTYLGGQYLRPNGETQSDPRRNFDPCGTHSFGVAATADAAYLVGVTFCPDLAPSSGILQGPGDAFMSPMDTTTGEIGCTTLIGYWDAAESVAADQSGNVYVGGGVNEANLPNATNTMLGSGAGFVSELTAGGTCARQRPALSWNSPDPIQYPTPLGDAQLDATANVPGTFTYDPPAGTGLQPGTGQILLATFTPTDTADYTPETITTTIDVSSGG